MTEEISIGSFNMFGSPCVYECVVQYGGLSVASGVLKGFSRICCDVGLNLGSLRVYLKCFVVKDVRSVGVSGSVLLEISEIVGVGD